MNISENFTIGFIGLGLIGGSIAKSIRRIFPTYKIIAYDTDKDALECAYSEGIVDQFTYSVDSSFSNCDYVFLCAPVHFNILYLDTLKNVIKPCCILTDVGSVKSDIYKAIEDKELSDFFIGGHPMVGSERCGYEASNDRLIENAYYFITPSKTVNKVRVEEFKTFIEDLGAMTIIYSPEDHDKVTAYISHIPHIIASTLVNLVKSTDTPDGINKQLAAGGFKDITRIASSSPLVWEHILLSNGDNIVAGLKEFTTYIEGIIDDIQSDSGQKINKYFESARDYRNSIPDNATGVIRMSYEVFVDIPDEAGALAKVVNIISDKNISLKNIGITHNREDLEGVLRLAFYKDEDSNKAIELLKTYGYTIYKR